MLLNKEIFKPYIDRFNEKDNELYIQAIDNASAWMWMAENVPYLDCPDPEILETYYFRWWTFRKHLKHTEDGWVITEFLPQVTWSGRHNTICGPLGHHIYEGRWLRNSEYLTNYTDLLLHTNMLDSKAESSTWFADAMYQFCKVTGNMDWLLRLLPKLAENFHFRADRHLHASGMYWSRDDGQDGMEFSVSGPGLRPTLNSYLYGDAKAIARLAELAGNDPLQEEFARIADKLKSLVQDKLWDSKDRFFKTHTLARTEDAVEDWDFANADPNRSACELVGYIPWYFDLPDPGFEDAWKRLMDPMDFYAPFGPTTVQQRHPGFGVYYEPEELVKAVNEGRCYATPYFTEDGHECLWNGPSWPYATTQTLKAMEHLLNGYAQSFVTKADYLELMHNYARSHRLTLEDGTVVPFIDENLDPFTGRWLARTWLQSKKGVAWRLLPMEERGKDYNHSCFCDLVISGLIGIQPCEDDRIEIKPLIPEGSWDYFCLDHLLYHGREITVVYDKTGERYGKGTGLRLYANGKELAHADGLTALSAAL